MSSILDALKKAQQGSATVDGGLVPWPTPISAANRRSNRRWWILSAVLIGLGSIVGGTYWLAARSDAPSPVDTQPVAVQPPQTTVSSPPPKPTIPVRARMKTAPPPVRTIAPLPSLPPPAIKPRTVITARQPATQSRRTPRPDVRQPDKPEAPLAKAATPVPQTPMERQATLVEQDDKHVRKDPRIDLQALVWAPEAADRFVVINNHLVKEGGSVDKFVVVEINRDDVLIAEGAKRWYEQFSIR